MEKLEKWLGENRPTALLIVTAFALVSGWIFDWVLGSHLFNQIFYPELSTVAGTRAWSAAIYSSVLLFGRPSAFLLWFWRDKNVRDQLAEKKNEVENQRLQMDILKSQVDVQGKQVDLQGSQLENQRNDLFLREFQEVQKVAAGLFDISGSEQAKAQLQIAAMHQLRGFFQDGYPETFRRAAFELLLAGHASVVIEDLKENLNDQLMRYEIANIFDKSAPTTAKERAKILRDDSAIIFRLGFPLQGRIFDFLDFYKFCFNKLDLSSSSFIAGKLSRAEFQNCRLSSADFTAALLREAKFDSAHLFDANFAKSILNKASFAKANASWASFHDARPIEADFQGADLKYARFTNSVLKGANLAGAICSNAQFQGADLSEVIVDDHSKFAGASFDDETVFASNWQSLAEKAKADYRSLWRGRGMKHVDDDKAPDELDDDIPF